MIEGPPTSQGRNQPRSSPVPSSPPAKRQALHPFNMGPRQDDGGPGEPFLSGVHLQDPSTCPPAPPPLVRIKFGRKQALRGSISVASSDSNEAGVGGSTYTAERPAANRSRPSPPRRDEGKSALAVAAVGRPPSPKPARRKSCLYERSTLSAPHKYPPNSPATRATITVGC